MKRLFIFSVLYIYLETGICADQTNNDVRNYLEAHETPGDHIHSSLNKRSVAFKRLPGWSVYYGKRSVDEPATITSLKDTQSNVKLNEFDDVRQKIDSISVSSEDGSAVSQNPPSFIEHSTPDSGNMADSEQPFPSESKRGTFKRLQTWMSTYGKRSGIDYSESDFADISGNTSDDGLYSEETDSDINEDKRAPGWHVMYGKRSPGWSATYGKRPSLLSLWYNKRMPGWSATYGKRAPGWSVTYGKRAPGWSVTYGKRAPGWSVTYGKRAPGWSVTYGKRAPGWTATYGKRSPGWSATYGKRAPGWTATYGKRSPGWTVTYGKRAPGWAATYGKRIPGWSATYGKRDLDWPSAHNDYDLDSNAGNAENEPINSSEDIDMLSDSTDKRSQAWSAFYGR